MPATTQPVESGEFLGAQVGVGCSRQHKLIGADRAGSWHLPAMCTAASLGM